MSLSEDSNQVFKEIRYAESERDKYIVHLDTIRDSRASPWYDSNEIGTFDRENTAFAYGAMMKPQLSFGDPLARITTKLQGMPAIAAKAIESGVCRNSVDTSLGEEVDDVVEDCFSHYGMMFSRLVEDTDAPMIDWMEEKGGGRRAPFHPWRPISESLDIKCVGLDPVVKKKRACRYIFHAYAIDKEDLIHMAERDKHGLWDIEVIRKLPVNSQLDKTGRKSSDGFPDRNEVVMYHVWVADRNRVYIVGATEIAKNGEVPAAGFVKKPHAFDGPPTGPYTMYGFYKSRKSAYPLGPLSAVWGQHRSLNDEVQAQDESSNRRKVIGLYDEMDENVAMAVKAAKDGDLVPIRDLSRDRVVALALGGADPVRQVVIEQKRERLERILGLSNAKRGIVTGGASATENAIADQSISAIMGYVQKRTRASNIQLLKLHARWMFENDSVVYPVTAEVGQQLEEKGIKIKEMMVSGGMFKAEARFPDFEFDIDDASTMYVSEPDRQQRKMQLMGIYTTLVPLKRQFPEADVKGLLREVGTGSGNHDADRFYDDKLAMGLASALIGQPVEAETAEPAGQARLTGPGRGAQPGPQTPTVGDRGGGSPAPKKMPTGAMNGASK